MNYYLELLESYSKLKKRSLKLNKEQEEDTSLLEKMVGKKKKGEAVLKQGETGSRKGSSKKMAMGKERQMVSSAKQVVQIGMTAGGQYIKLLHPDGKQKLSVGKSTSRAGNVLIRARFGGHSWGTPIADGTGASTGSQLQGYGELEQWLRSDGQPGAAGGNEEENKEKSDKAVQADADQEAEDLANAMLSQEEWEHAQRMEAQYELSRIGEDIGYPSPSPGSESESTFADGFDFYGEDTKGKNDFIEALKGFVDTLVDDVNMDLQVKTKALENLKELVGVATDVRGLGGWMDEEGRMHSYPVPGDLEDRLRNIKDLIGGTSRSGEIALSRDHPTEVDDVNKLLANDILLIGRAPDENGLISASKGHAIKAFTQLRTTLNAGIKLHNNAIKDPLSNSIIDKDWFKVDVKRSGTPGADANRRCDIDEGLVAAAGIIHSLGDLGGKVEVGSELTGESPAKRKFLKGKLADSVASILKSDTVEGAASYLRSGLDQIQGNNARTLLNADAAEYAAALEKRLISDVGMEKTEAEEFLIGLSEDGKKVLALALLFRYNTVKNIFGDVKPEYSIAVGRRGERITGRKVDNAFVFRPDQAEKLLAQLNKKTGLTKESIKGYTEKGTIASFIERGILDATDFPEGHSVKEEILLHRFSLKTHSNISSDSSQGSAVASTVVPSSAPPGFLKDEFGQPTKVPNPEIEFREQIEKSVADVTNATAQKKFYSFLDQCKLGMYKENKPNGNSREQNKFFWGRVLDETTKLKGTDLKNFQKSLATYLLVLGGGSKENQLNIVSYSDTGAFTAQDDHTFRADVVEKIKTGKWVMNFSISKLTGGIITIGPKKKGKIKPMLKVNGKGKRNDVWKSGAYQKKLLIWKDTGLTHTMDQENSSTMLRQFLSSQAKMIQELLSTE